MSAPAQPPPKGHAGSSRLRRAWRAVADRWPFGRGALWAADVRDMPRARRFLFEAVRVVAITASALVDQLLAIRAAGLTFFTLLSIVPFLALAFAVLKGLGAYAEFSQSVLWPYVKANFAHSPALLSAVQRVLAFVNRTDVSSLGTGGLIFLIYVSVTLLANVETILNQEWGVRRGRPLKRKLTDYLTLMVISPILVLSAGTFFTAAQTSSIVGQLQGALRMAGLLNLVLSVASWGVIFLALTALYLIMPHTHVRLRSALVGALLGSVLWQLVLYLQVQLQMGVARYNAMYAGFAALPIFLYWMWLSWLVVLIGGRLAARHQLQDLQTARRPESKTSQRGRERIAVTVVAEAVRGITNPALRPSPQTIANRLAVPVPIVQDVVQELVSADLLARVAPRDGELGPAERILVPVGDIDAKHLSDVIAVMREVPLASDGDRTPPLAPALAAVLEQVDETCRDAGRDLSLRQLARLAEPPAPEHIDSGP